MDPPQKRRGRRRKIAYPIYLGDDPLVARKRQNADSGTERAKVYLKDPHPFEPELEEVPVAEAQPQDEPLRPSDVRPILASLHNRVTSKNYWDTYIGALLNTAGSVGLLTTIAQGTSQQERVGKRVRLTSLHLRGVLSVGTTVSVQPLYATLLVVFDRDPTGILPGIFDILSNSPVAVTAALAHSNDVNSTRFRVVMRRTYTLDPIMQHPVAIDEFLDLKGLYTVYGSATTGVLGNIKQGALYYAAAALQDPATPTENLTLALSTRCRFINAP